MVKIIALVAALLLLPACAIAPEGTSLDRMFRSLYHVDHPEYGRPITQAETRADFTGTHKGASKIAQAAWESDAKRCDVETAQPRDPALSIRQEFRRAMDTMWDCMWRKGWRWETDAPPSP